LYSFTGGNDGWCPYAALVQGSDGYLYGTTPYGGNTNLNSGWGFGTVFKISTNGAFTSLYLFTGGNDGTAPYGGLVQGSDGSFYGTTSGGGTNSGGTVFKISTNGALTTLYSFGSQDTSGVILDGSGLSAALMQGSDGYLYGTTGYGGTYTNGTVFKISTNGALTTLYSFTGDDGVGPVGALVQGSDGDFYGTTAYTCYSWSREGFGPSGAGTVFKISSNGAFTSLYSLTGGNNGWYPQAGLVQGSDGSFYGTTEEGGMYGSDYGGYGTVFKISTNGAFTSLYSFGSVLDTSGVALDCGAFPIAALVQGSDGYLYGTTYEGGTKDMGTVFRLTIVPGLTIIPSAPYIILTWPTDYNGFSYAGLTLQSTTNLGSSAVWSTNSSAPVVIGGENVVINPITGRQQFYRLSQ
jgi:uncharacterized repeat protein (TIGR03803 family)